MGCYDSFTFARAYKVLHYQMLQALKILFLVYNSPSSARGREGCIVEGPTSAYQGPPPAIYNFIKVAFLRLALETQADPRRCVDPRRRDALEDRIW